MPATPKSPAPHPADHTPATRAHAQTAIDTARAEHALVVKEPPRGLFVDARGTLHSKSPAGVLTPLSPQPPSRNPARILTYIHQGLSWPRVTYTNSSDFDNGGFEWCGAFAAYCYKHLKQEIRAKHMASTYRLHAFCKNTPRHIPLSQLQPGDILVVGHSQSKPWGAHVTLVHSVDTARSLAHTYEGNATGTLGDQTRGEGVITHSRPLAPTSNPKQYYAMHAYRWLESDYT